MPGSVNPLKSVKMSREGRALFGVFLPFFMIHCAEQVYFVYGNLLHGYGFSPQAIGWILGVFFMSVMAARALGSWTIENFGVGRTLVWSSIASFAGCSALFFHESIPLLFFGRVLAGAAFGVYTMGLFTYQAMTVPENTRGKDFALVVSGGILPIATVGPLGEWLLVHSFLSVYLSIGPILSLSCLLLGRKLGSVESAERKKSAVKHWGTYRELAASRKFVALVATGLLIAIVDAFIVSISILARERGILVSYFMASVSVTAVIVRVAGARALNALPRALVIAPCGMLMAGAALYMSITPSNLSFLVGGILTGLGIGAGWPLYHALIGDILEPALTPKGTAVALLVYDSGWFITPLLVGYASPVLGIAATFGALSLVAIVSLGLLHFLYWVPLKGSG
jgi:MFS family permease